MEMSQEAPVTPERTSSELSEDNRASTDTEHADALYGIWMVVFTPLFFLGTLYAVVTRGMTFEMTAFVIQITFGAFIIATMALIVLAYAESKLEHYAPVVSSQ